LLDGCARPRIGGWRGDRCRGDSLRLALCSRPTIGDKGRVVAIDTLYPPSNASQLQNGVDRLAWRRRRRRVAMDRLRSWSYPPPWRDEWPRAAVPFLVAGR